MTDALTADSSPQTSRRPPLLERVAGPLVLLLLVLALFAPVLVNPGGRVLGAQGKDTTTHVLWWHRFAFGELRGGNLPLWNPHVFGGGPFLGAFSSGLLYPPNWIELLLPTHVALNWIYAAHVFLAGLFAYLCCRARGLSKPAGVLAGAAFMLSGPYFLHIYPGHPTVIGGMTWMPLALLGADRLADTGRWRWGVLAAAAVAVMVYAGSQHFYMAGIVGGAYAVLHAIAGKDWRARLRPLIACAAIFAGAGLLAAAELAPTLEASHESARQGGLPIEVAATFSLPPENLATAFAPHLFGRADNYVGRAYLWEVCLFCGVTTVLLAAAALLRRDPQRRRFGAIMMILTLVLALGYHTPLFKILYHWLPGYNAFRGSAKFADFTALFLAILAAVGLDHLAIRARDNWRPVALFAAIAIALLAGSLVIRSGAGNADGLWGRTLRQIDRSGESEARDVDYTDVAVIRATGERAADGLLVAFAVAGAVTALSWLHGRTRHAAYALVGLGLLEMFLFARQYTPTADANPPLPAPWADQLRQHRGDYRVMLPDPRWANWGMRYGFDNLYGHHPNTITRRFLDLVATSQGTDPDTATHYVKVTRFPDALRLLRCRYVLMPDRDRPVIEMNDPLPRALLVSNYVVATAREDVLGRVLAPTFDPRSLVVLESEPSPPPQPGGERGTVEASVVSTDELHIVAEVPAATILLVTDNYSRLWRAAPLSPGPQASYEVLPANWTLRAIPLAAGKHHIRLRYEPRALLPGFLTTAVTLAGLAGAGLFVTCRPRFRSTPA